MIVTLEELNKYILDDNIFIVKCGGGTGNYIGCMLRAALFYKLCDLKKTHKLVIISIPMYNGDFVLSDIFEDTDNIYFYNCPLLKSQMGINYSSNSFEINDFRDLRNYSVNSFEINEFVRIFLDVLEIKISELSGHKNIVFNTNSIYIPPDKLNYCKELLKDLNIHIKSDIKEQINNFLKEHKIGGDGYSIGVHFRCTDTKNDVSRDTDFNACILKLDNILINDKDIENIFVCSDDENVEEFIKKRYANNYNCISFKKNSQVRKIPSLENYDWFINKKSDIKEIKDKGLNNVPGWGIQSNNNNEYIFNVWRDKDQVIGAIIDTVILNTCSKGYTNTASSFKTLGHLLINLNLL